MDRTDFETALTTGGMSPEQAATKAPLFVEALNCLRASGKTGRDLFCCFVPGRIEFLGKHTDYAGGRSLICALERGFCVVAAARDDAVVRVTDARSNDRVEFSFDPGLVSTSSHWSGYPMTVARRISSDFPGSRRGADIAFISDLPGAAGLSSSSAFIVAIFRVLARFNELYRRQEYLENIRSLEDLAGYLGAVESGRSFGSLLAGEGVGTLGGSQDHTAILCSQSGRLSLYRFSPVRLERTIALPDEYVFVIGVSGISAEKTATARERYNRLSRLASEVLDRWVATTGRDDETLMDAATGSPDAPDRIREVLRKSREGAFSTEELLNRFDQFLLEAVEIIPSVAEMLSHGRLGEIGPLVDRSQAAAGKLLNNQVRETIELVQSARQLGATAASAFGAGFGGSVWALLRTEGAERLAAEWASNYRSRFGISPERSPFFLSSAGPALIEFEA